MRIESPAGFDDEAVHLGAERRKSSWRTRLAEWVDNPVTDLLVAALIVVSVVIITVEAITPVVSPWRPPLVFAGDMITYFFVLELSCRFLAERRKRRFFAKFWIDILAVLPILRPLRFLRVLRVLRLFRFGVILNRRYRRVSSVFVEGRTEFLTVLLVLTLVVLIGSVGIVSVEGRRDPRFDTFDKALWWSLFSLCAGEPVPACPDTPAGKAITLVVVFGGLTVFAMFTGVVSAFMVRRLRSEMEVKAMDLEDVTNHIIICGWNRSGTRIVEEFQGDLRHRKRPIVIIAERDHEPVLDYRVVQREMVFFISGDYTQVEILEKARVRHADYAILLADKSKTRSDQDRDARTVLAALTIEKMNKEIFTSVELLSRDNESHLKLAGVEEVVVGDEYAGNIIAADARSRGGIVRMVNELFTNRYGNEFFKLPIPAAWIGKPLLEIHCILKERYEAILVSVFSAGRDEILVNPPRNYLFGPGDSVLLIATTHPDLEGEPQGAGDRGSP